jgi:hypothetical protein
MSRKQKEEKMELEEFSKERQILEIFSYMEWEKIHSAMRAVNWEWSDIDGAPSIKDMMDFSRKLLEGVWEYGGSLNSGGFKASKNEKGFLSLEFIICSVDSEEIFK